jgi:hypothetical protein
MRALVDAYNAAQDDYAQLVNLCDLFLTADYWLKYYQSNAGYQKEYANIVTKLYGNIVDALCASYKCTSNVLPDKLQTMFGRELRLTGYNVDSTQRLAEYAEAGEVEKYRLRFKDGKAYQYPWWQFFGGTDSALVLCESKRAQPRKQVHTTATGGDVPDWGYCVMSMNRELYMARHEAGDEKRKKKGVYHSYYLAGRTPMFSGSMLIEAGEIKGIAPNSGHYKSNKNNTLALLQALQMFSVPLTNVSIYDKDCNFESKAPAFLRSNGKWRTMENASIATRNEEEDEWLAMQHKSVQEWAEFRRKVNQYYYDRRNTKAPQTPDRGAFREVDGHAVTIHFGAPPLPPVNAVDSPVQTEVIPDGEEEEQEIFSVEEVGEHLENVADAVAQTEVRAYN